MKKRTIVIIGSIVGFIILLGGIFLYYYLSIDRREYLIHLKGQSELTIEVHDEYIEEGAYVTVDGEIDESFVVKIDDNLKTDTLGKYEITYVVEEKESLKASRNVNIVDTTNPEIVLKEGTVTILIGETFEEPGFDVTDNYDKDLNEKVQVTGEIDTENEGQYTLTYTVEDSSKNSVSIQREIIVQKPLEVVVYVPKQEEKAEEAPVIVAPNDDEVLNEVTSITYSGEGILLKGNNETAFTAIQLIEKNTGSIIEFPTSFSGNNYVSSINLSSAANGTYTVNGKEIESKLSFKLDTLLRLARGRIGNKLVTFSYPNETVEITVEDFYYQYDIAINVGHGGVQPGAINAYIQEKEMNLIVSKYEKQRYEAHGLSVYISRMEDNYGELMGDSNWAELTRSAYAFGYYSSVSKVAYSNHHNSSESSSNGWEIIASKSVTASGLAVEYAIGAELNTIYPNLTSRSRIYTRDYETGRIFTKANGQVYDFRTYYAIVRVPEEIFNTQTLLYEPMYMSNPSEFQWYWQNGNWKQVSEVKIKNYVQSIGKTYIAP